MIFLISVHLICMFGNRLSETDQPAVSSGPLSVTAVVVFSKGFACACGLSVVHLFEKSEDRENFRKTREIYVCVMSIISACSVDIIVVFILICHLSLSLAYCCCIEYSVSGVSFSQRGAILKVHLPLRN